jgi:hypothetical protein
MRESRMFGLMSGEGKRGLRHRLKNPRLSSTLQIKCRKRHILVDTLGLLLNVVVHPADIQDRDGAFHLLRRARRLFPFIERIFADGGYAWISRPAAWLATSNATQRPLLHSSASP